MSLFKLAPSMAFLVYKFPDPDTGRMHIGKSIQDLAATIRVYRAQNELPEIEYLEAVIEHYLCKCREHIGACEAGKPLKRGIVPFIKGGLLLLKNLAYNQFVTQEEADKRGNICMECPLNQFPDKTDFVKWSDDLALMTIGNRKSSNHDKLGTCIGCGCPLRCKVWFGGKIKLTKKEEDKIKPINPRCWQLNG